MAGGGYEARSSERQQAVAASEAEGRALSAKLARLEGEHAAVERRLRAQEAALQEAGAAVPADTDARIGQAAAAPERADPDARIAALKRSISDMQALSAQLAALAG